MYEEPDIINILDDDDVKKFNEIKDTKIREQVRVAISILYYYGEKFLSLEEACTKYNMTSRGFRKWRKDIPFISDLYYKAKTRKKTNFNTEINKRANKSMMDLVTGYEYPEISYTYEVQLDIGGKEILIPKEKKVTMKRVLPHPQLIQYVLGNTSNWRPPTYVDRDVDNTPEWERKINAMSSEELVELTKELTKKKEEILAQRLKENGE